MTSESTVDITTTSTAPVLTWRTVENHYPFAMTEVCPRCAGPLHCFEEDIGALSRLDNGTIVCGPCGTDEAYGTGRAVTTEWEAYEGALHRAERWALIRFVLKEGADATERSVHSIESALRKPCVVLRDRDSNNILAVFVINRLTGIVRRVSLENKVVRALAAGTGWSEALGAAFRRSAERAAQERAG